MIAFDRVITPKRELRRVEMKKRAHVLEEDQRYVGRVLGVLDLVAPARFEGGERARDSGFVT